MSITLNIKDLWKFNMGLIWSPKVLPDDVTQKRTFFKINKWQNLCVCAYSSDNQALVETGITCEILQTLQISGSHLQRVIHQI